VDEFRLERGPAAKTRNGRSAGGGCRGGCSRPAEYGRPLLCRCDGLSAMAGLTLFHCHQQLQMAV